MRAPRSLRARVALAALGALAAVGVLAAIVLLAAIEREGRNAVDHDLEARAERLVERPPGAFGGPGPFDGPRGLLAGSGQFVQVAVGGRVLRQGDVPANPPDVPARDGLATVDIDGTPWRSLTLSDGGGDVRVELLASLASVQERVASTRRLVVVLGLAALLVTGAAAWALTSLALRPLRRLQEGAARVSGARDLTTPLPDEGPEEVRALAGSLNDMLGRLEASTAATERALAATRRFAADAGHELRTPLTGMRAKP
jgi:two-component system sensor histidine kinase PrrB